MRFPRQAKIFRGQLDAAPVAAVFFLLVLMLMLQYAQTFIPGVRVELKEPGEVREDPGRTIRVLRTGKIDFREKRYDIEDLERYFREETQLNRLPRNFFFDVEPGADTNLVKRVESVALEVGARLKSPGSRLELPEFAGFPGVTNPVVVLAVNLNGQIFLQQQLVREENLREKLAAMRERTEQPLTLVLQADKEVRHGRIMKVLGIAKDAGIAEISIATRPPVQPN
jgi:biopolymer transport protein ExbD